MTITQSSLFVLKKLLALPPSNYKTVAKWLVMALLSVTFPVEATDLLGIYHEAQQYDAAFASARAAYQAGLEKLPQGRALLLPSVNLRADGNNNDVNTRYDANIPGLRGGGYNYNSEVITLSLTQPLYNKEKFSQYGQAKEQIVQAEAQLGAAQQDLIIRTAQAYFDALLAQNNVDLAGAQKMAISEQLEQAKRNFEVGVSTITDTHEAQAKHDLASAQEIAAKNDLEVKKSVLQKIIGKIPEQLFALGEKLPLNLPQPDDIAQWMAAAEQQNLLLQIQRAIVEVAKQDVERNRGGHYPTVDLVASYSDNNAGGSIYGVGSDNRTSTVGVQLNLPLFQGGAINSRVREAEANQGKALHDMEQAKRQAALDARQAFLGVASEAAHIRALEQALVSSLSSLDSTKIGLEVGVRTNVDVLNAQQQLYSTRRDLFQARYSYLMNQLKLKAAVGKLSEEDLQQINQWLTNK